MDVVRYSQFLLDPTSSDRLRLESLAATLQLARQALVAEDVVLSRNAYMVKYSELSKSYLYKGLQCLQDLKQRCAQSDQIRQDLFQQSCSFLKEMIDNKIVLRSKTVHADGEDDSSLLADSIKPFAMGSALPSSWPSYYSSLTASDSIIQTYESSAKNMVQQLTEDTEAWKRANPPLNTKGNKSRKGAGGTSSKQQGGSAGILPMPDERPVENRDDVLHEYASWVLDGQQEFQNQVSQSMSRCIKMTLNALENRFMRISKSSSDHQHHHTKAPIKSKDGHDSSGNSKISGKGTWECV
jgi:hypothetical protein